MTNSEERIEFWKELWTDLISNFLKRPAFGLKLYNPHILVEDIISEIEDNSFKNLDNKNYFYAQLNYYLENDPAIKACLHSKFQIARRNFEPNKSNYLLEILKDVKTSFSSGFYFEKSLDLLIEILLNEEIITKEFIDECRYLSQVIIIEFMKRKYTLEDIKDFTKHIFENYKYEDDGRLVTSYPHNLSYTDYERIDNKTNPQFYTDVKEIIDNLTISKRLKALSTLYNKKAEKVHYIFVVEGLKGSVNIEIAGITFYSLDQNRFTKIFDNKEFDEENLQMNKEDDFEFLQAAVEVDYLTSKSSLLQAINKLENALDLISCYYNTKTPLELDISRYIVVKDNKLIHWSSGTDKRARFQKHIDSLDIQDFNSNFEILMDKDILWKNFTDKSVLKIRNAIHWHRKAQESKKDEDKLLHYWISIENLFTETNLAEILKKNKTGKIHIIQEVISSNQILPFIFGYGWDLYWHYDNKSHKLHHSQKMIIPDELIEKANFNRKTGEKIYLKKFIDCLDEIEPYETNPFFVEQLRQVKEFYKNPKIAKEIIDKQIEQIQTDLLMIYRFRNLIVHNAHFDNTLLKYYVWKIKQFSNNFLRSIIENLENDKTLPEIIFSIHAKREHFLNDMEMGKFDVFDQ